MQISENCVKIVKKFEGLFLSAYVCPAGVWTIGYGHTGSVHGLAIHSNMKITAKTADELLTEDLKKFEKHVNSFDYIYHWNQNEFDALVSFAFNVGNIKQLTNNGKRTKAQIAEAILLYDKGGGKVLPGLTRRRKEERELFLKEVETVSTVKKLPVIVNGKEYEVNGIFENGTNYFSIRQIANLLGIEVSNKGSIPILKK